MAHDPEIHALDAVLRVAAVHPNILEAESFAELSAAIRAVIAADRLTVLVPDGPRTLRVVAVAPADEHLPFGAHLEATLDPWRDLFEEQQGRISDDPANGDAIERAAARGGVRSYAAFPMRVPVAGGGATRAVGVLTFSFFTAGGAEAAPAALAQRLADALGPSVERALLSGRAQRLAMILETSADAMLAWDRAGLVTDANRAAAALTGRSRAELIGTPIADLLDPPPLSGDASPPRAAGDSAPPSDGVRLSLLARGEGGVRRVPVSATVTTVPGDALVAAHALLRDLSQVVRAEEDAAAARSRLIQTDRLSTLGTLAAGVAHEINNPAAFILLGLDMLGRVLSGPGVQMDESAAEGAGETLRELRESIRRIVDIARDLRLFASAGGGPRTFVDVNRMVESALSLTRGQILERAQIDRRLEDVPPVMMEDGRLGQVLVNLLVNAVHAIPRTYTGDQRITVATRSDGRTVEIEVTDTGVGIPAENLDRVFQPFFTTKGPGGGAGLGLSISREIVERAGGSIRVQSPVEAAGNTGSRFVISLPAAGQEDPEIDRDSPVPSCGGPSARVLIVEDEPALCRALADEIGRCHEVEVASGGEPALALLNERRFDAVLCDLRMPDLSGEALYRRVLERDEEQAAVFVFMTGVGFGAEVERFLAETGRPLLEKPFPATAALEAIARVVKKSGDR